MAGDFGDTQTPELRVLHVIGSLDVGGAEVVLQQLVQASQGSSIHHEVVSLTTIGPIGQALMAAGIQVSSLQAQTVRHLPRTILRLARMIRRQQPDIVQTWLYHADLIGGLAARFAGHRALMWSVHSTHLHFGTSRLTSRLRGVLAALSSRMPAKIIYVAQASRKVHEACGYAQHKGLVIPNGFDVARFAPDANSRRRMREYLGLPTTCRVIGSVGRYNADKDHAMLFEAAALVLQQHPGCRFLLAGAGLSADNPAIIAQFKMLNLSHDAFLLLGPRNDIPELLNAMDVFCLHSRSEAFPLVLGEAMACGVPPVTTDVGDAALLTGGITSPVTAGDAPALATRLCELISMDDDGLTRLGNAARQRIKSNYAFDRMVSNYKSAYKTVLKDQV
jgi:glycosyltransferase involved in cell wall biosynthesis